MDLASLRTAEEMQNNSSEGGEPFDFNSIPPGYRFNPTDGEIIAFYSRKKIYHQPLPPNKIVEVDLYAYDPDELAARYEPSGNGEWLYFTPRDRKYRNGQRPNRAIDGHGYWKATGADKEIKFEDRTVGYRRALVFCRGGAQKGVKTNWIMHEYTVAKPRGPPRRSGVNDMRLDDCVLCRVYRKDKKIGKKSRHESGLDESGPSSSTIPRLEPSPDPNDANHPYEEQRLYISIQMPIQTQQPQPGTEILQTPPEHDQFALQWNTFPTLDPSVLMLQPTPHQSHYIGNVIGGQGPDNFDIMNGASVSNSSFDFANIDFGNVPDMDAAIDFGNVPGFNSTDHGNPGLYPVINYGDVPGFNSTDHGNLGLLPVINYGNDAAPMSSNMNGNYIRSLLHGINNNRQP